MARWDHSEEERLRWLRNYQRRQRELGHEGGATGHSVYPYSRVPAEDIAARLAEIPPDTRTVTGILCGDPLPGRRAIDRARPR